MQDDFEVCPNGSFSHWVWDNKYRHKTSVGTPIDKTVNDTFRRVAQAVAGAESGTTAQQLWASKFYEAMKDFEFVPGGRILAGAGTDRKVTLFNCYVMGTIEDSLEGIHKALTESALTLKQGGGVGMDFSTLRWNGAPVKSVDSVSSGAVSFMHQWDVMCATIMSAGARRGAMMGVLRCDHPDIEEFIDAKSKPGVLTNFNVSVGITNAFMVAALSGDYWDLVFDGEVIKRVDARHLWQKIMRATYESSEPGVVFLDKVNASNPLRDAETIAASNPCGEQMLPPYGACLLGSINLARLIKMGDDGAPTIDRKRLEELVHIAVRFLDNVIDVSGYPLPQQEDEAKHKRRIGLGVMGLADALTMCGLEYDSTDGRKAAATWLNLIDEVSRATSRHLADAKGAYPAWQVSHGPKRRNSHLMSIAPTGTTSAFAGNVSSGVEPVFAYEGRRNVLQADGSTLTMDVTNYIAAMGGMTLGKTATEIAPHDHVEMVAALQPHIDSAISKTVNVPTALPFDDFMGIYETAWKLGCKGCTTYRPSDLRGAVLLQAKDEDETAHDKVVPLRGDDTGILERPESMVGITYKLKPAGFEHALYVTINDFDADGHHRPFELFLNSKDPEGHEWRVALSRMISAVFRKGGDVGFVADELRAVYAPRGGFWHNKEFVPSVCALIGDTIKRHTGTPAETEAIRPDLPTSSWAGSAARHCPQCLRGSISKETGCWCCNRCDYTKC